MSAVCRAKHCGGIRIAICRIRQERSIDCRCHRQRRLGSDQTNRRNVIRRRILTGQRRETDRRELPLIARRSGHPFVLTPFWRTRSRRTFAIRNSTRQKRPHSGRNFLTRDRPLPLEHPETTGWSNPHRVLRQRAVRRSVVVQIRQARRNAAQHLKHVRNFRGSESIEMSTSRFTGDPPAQISGAPAQLSLRVPEMIRRWNRRMISMRKISRFRKNPAVMRVVRNSYEGKRATESIDDLLIVSLVAEVSFRSPGPSGRQLPSSDVGRQRSRFTRLDGRAAR